MMNTKAVCQRLSVTPKMLRIYEEQGLIHPERLDNNYRNYSMENLIQIETISVLRHLGFSISEIKSILTFDKTKNEYLDMLYLQYKALDAQIRELQNKKNELKGNINKLMDSCEDENFNDILIRERNRSYKKLLNYDDIINAWNFDEMASDFINRYMKEDIPYQKTIRRLQEMIRSMGKNTFTDVGCGTCNLWQEIGDEKDILAIDSSLPMLIESKKKFPWIKVSMDDILSLDINSYRKSDVVVSAFMLHHIDYCDQYKAADNILKLCREGGIVLIADRCYRDPAMKGSDKTEFFIIAEEMKQYLQLKNTEVKIEYTDENMVIFIVKRLV